MKLFATLILAIVLIGALAGCTAMAGANINAISQVFGNAP